MCKQLYTLCYALLEWLRPNFACLQRYFKLYKSFTRQLVQVSLFANILPLQIFLTYVSTIYTYTVATYMSLSQATIYR